MFCNLCRLTNTVHPTNTSKIWNCEPNIRYRSETVKDNFKKDICKQTMHKDTVTTELTKHGTYFVEKEKKEETYYTQVTKKSSLPCTSFINKRLPTAN